MNYSLIILNLFFLSSIIYSNAILTNDNDLSSLNISCSFLRDNHNFIDAEDQMVKLTSDMSKISLGYILKGKYEFNLIHQNINDLNNGFMLPFIGNYNFFNFKYHLKERPKFPISISFNLEVGINRKEEFDANSFGITIYKYLNNDSYPIVPYISFDESQFDYFFSEDSNSMSNKTSQFICNKLGVLIILPVKGNENDLIKDSIWIDFNINEIQKDLFLGITFGVNHPISF